MTTGGDSLGPAPDGAGCGSHRGVGVRPGRSVGRGDEGGDRLKSAFSVLAIEDDPDIRQLLGSLLGREGYVVTEAATGREGLRAFHEHRPDLVILDLGLPDLDGWQVLERLRDVSDAPVLVLSARSSERDKVRGLTGGADDYLTKPFSRVELLARLQVLRRRLPTRARPRDGLRRRRHPPQLRPVPADGAGQDGAAHPDRVPAAVGPGPARGQVLSAEQLTALAWEDRSSLSPDRVKYAVLRLRRKLTDEDRTVSPVETVRGFGYRYRAPTR